SVSVSLVATGGITCGITSAWAYLGTLIGSNMLGGPEEVGAGTVSVSSEQPTLPTRSSIAPQTRPFMEVPLGRDHACSERAIQKPRSSGSITVRPSAIATRRTPQRGALARRTPGVRDRVRPASTRPSAPELPPRALRCRLLLRVCQGLAA